MYLYDLLLQLKHFSVRKSIIKNIKFRRGLTSHAVRIEIVLEYSSYISTIYYPSRMNKHYSFADQPSIYADVRYLAQFRDDGENDEPSENTDRLKVGTCGTAAFVDAYRCIFARIDSFDIYLIKLISLILIKSSNQYSTKYIIPKVIAQNKCLQLAIYGILLYNFFMCKKFLKLILCIQNCKL